MEIGIVLGLLALAIVLFSTEKIGVDAVTMGLLIILVLTHILTAQEAFTAFGSEFLVILASIFVINSAIESSGVLDALAERISRTKAAKVTGLLLWVFPFTALLSAFMNNTTVTALMIAPVLALAKRSAITPSRILMAVAFAGIVGGTCTLIGTSTNVAVNAYLVDHGIASLGMFDFLYIGATLVGVTFVYMLTIGRWLLPEREDKSAGTTPPERTYTSEIRVKQGSSLIGTRVGASELVRQGFAVVALVRDGRQRFQWKELNYQADDVVLVRGQLETLMAVKDRTGIDIMADELMGHAAAQGPLKLMEVLIPANSGLAGRTVKEARLMQNYGMAVVAVHRAEQEFTEMIGRITLEVGDVLLVEGSPDDLRDFHDQHNLVLLGEFTPVPRRVRNGFITLSIFIFAVVLGSLEWVPLSIAFAGAALATVLFRITSAEKAYASIDWRLLVLIGGMSAFGTAMANSGTDVFLSDAIISWFGPLGAEGVLAGFMVLTVLLTQPMSNAAAALVVLPVALRAASSLHVDPVTFAVAVMLSASMSLLTPFEPSCILVYGPGRYRFFDFVRVGGLITVPLLAIIFFMVQWRWPL
ncbi:MAG: SLC13 family permease [Flavobacteriales bacterium]